MVLFGVVYSLSKFLVSNLTFEGENGYNKLMWVNVAMYLSWALYGYVTAANSD